MSKKSYRAEAANLTLHPEIKRETDNGRVTEKFDQPVIRFTPRFETTHKDGEPPKRYGFFETEDPKQQALVESHIKKGVKIREIDPAEENAKDQIKTMLDSGRANVSAVEVLQTLTRKNPGGNVRP